MTLRVCYEVINTFSCRAFMDNQHCFCIYWSRRNRCIHGMNKYRLAMDISKIVFSWPIYWSNNSCNKLHITKFILRWWNGISPYHKRNHLLQLKLLSEINLRDSICGRRRINLANLDVIYIITHSKLLNEWWVPISWKIKLCILWQE